MALEINQTYARTGVDRTPARLEIQSQNAQVELRQKHAKVNIHTELPRVEIDQYEAFASAGLKGPIDLSREAAQRGMQQAAEYIGKVAADGDMLAAIENGGHPIADIAERDAYPEHEFGLDYIPKVGPKITVKGGVQYQPEENSQGIHNGVEANVTPASININFTPSKVNIFLKQYASISIRYTGKNVDIRI